METSRRNDKKTKASELYENLPRNLRGILYDAVMSNPKFPYHEGPDESFLGRFFIIATGNYTSPASSKPLNVIIDDIVNNKAFTPEQEDMIYDVYIEEIEKLTGETYIKKGRNLRGAQMVGIKYNLPEALEGDIGEFLTGESSRYLPNRPNLKTPLSRQRARLQQLAAAAPAHAVSPGDNVVPFPVVTAPRSTNTITSSSCLGGSCSIARKARKRHKTHKTRKTRKTHKSRKLRR
jgi:hypothetical protein